MTYHQPNDPAVTEKPVVLPAREARGATPGRPVRNVLFGGLALVIIAFLVIYYAFAG